MRYEAVDNLLDITANEYECDKLCVCCYHYLLEELLCYTRKDCDFQQTVEEVAQSYPRNTLIIRVHAHLTTAINGVVLDIWDCSKEFVDCFWIVK